MSMTELSRPVRGTLDSRLNHAGDERMNDSGWDVTRIRADFPGLQQPCRDKKLVYLDNAATAQKPQAVIDAVRRSLTQDAGNVHRAVHLLSERATRDYEEARLRVRRFLNAAENHEIIFTKGTTESINLVAFSHGVANVKAGDEIVVTHMEHHSNIVPWQMLCQRAGATLRVVPITDDGELIQDEYRRLLNDRTRVVAIGHVSNALGTVNPIREMIADAHQVGAVTVIDGAQAVPHLPIDVRDLDADFYAFSGHKLFGPTGIGVLYGKTRLLDAMPPYQGGGDMIASVSFEKTIYNELPHKFEAGTPNIAGVIGLGAAIDYVNGIGLERAADYEDELLVHATDRLAAIPGLTIVGNAMQKASVVSFVLDGVHPHDIGTILDQEGIAIRAGHHCAQPVMDRFGVAATARASFAFYNTHEEIDALADSLVKVREIFA